MPNKVVYAKEGKPKTWKEGNTCPRCYEVLPGDYIVGGFF